ncbi:MAG: hypothetical protein GY796_20500 [Chloroflexi bacterium]|nr:hypothetical protein [Chloroflexota bacterium]
MVGHGRCQRPLARLKSAPIPRLAAEWQQALLNRIDNPLADLRARIAVAEEMVTMLEIKYQRRSPLLAIVWMGR